MNTVQILLATYNSRAFLGEQLDSLFAQNYQDFEILVNDGGSQDDTLEIIADYHRHFPGRIRLLGSAPASACENFAGLLAAAESELIMFCDHDDVWKKDKISISIRAYREMEAVYGADCPILIFTDSEIVDSGLVTVLPSMMRSQKLNMDRFSPGRTVIQNYASGNTMLFNRALQKVALPVAPEAVMHDHWVALAASFFGVVNYVDIPSILYRQHGRNVIGAFRYSLKSCLKKFFSDSGNFRDKLYREIDQAVKLLSLHREILSEEQAELLEALSNFKKMGKIARWRFMWQNNMIHNGLLRNIAAFWYI